MNAHKPPNINPIIFDRALLAERAARVAARFSEYDFLIHEMADRLSERLQDLGHDFHSGLALGHHGGALARTIPGAWTQSPDEEQLAVPEAAFDLAVSCAGLHWVNDLPGALIQVQRALKTGGLFLAIFPGNETLHELRACLMEAELALTGGAAPRVIPFIDAREAAGLLGRAGFAEPVVDVERFTVTYSDMFTLMHDLRGMGETNALLARPKHFTRRGLFAAAAELYQQRFGAEGKITATVDFVMLTGWKS